MSNKTKNDYNELRLYANEIMRQLYEAGEADQLKILVSYGKVALEHIEAEKKAGKRP